MKFTKIPDKKLVEILENHYQNDPFAEGMFLEEIQHTHNNNGSGVIAIWKNRSSEILN